MVKRNSSLGVLISTLVFFFSGLWLIFEGKALVENQETFKRDTRASGGHSVFFGSFQVQNPKIF